MSEKGTMKGHSISGGHKRKTKDGAGMTKKGVAKYRKDNPGSKLKDSCNRKSKSREYGGKKKKIILC